MDKAYTTFKLEAINGNNDAIRLTISHGPINLVSYELLSDFYILVSELSTTENPPKVIVVSSANPNFWISHLDLHAASVKYPMESQEKAGKTIKYLGAVLEGFSSLPTIFIAEINGRAVAGGNEFALNMDMRFAGPGARFGIVEVAGGLIHVGALRTLTSLIGAGRAAEYMLGATSVSGTKAASIGWVNEAFETAEQLRTYVDELALRVALFPRGGLKATKQGIRETLAGKGDMGTDVGRFKVLLGTEEAQDKISRLIELSEGFSANEFELGLPESLVESYR